jgi:putative phosphoribosyl transferase
MICARRDAALGMRAEQLLDAGELHGVLAMPPEATGLVAMLYGTGDNRRAPVQEAIAQPLRSAGLAVCVVELLDPAEADDDDRAHDVPLLAHRMHLTLDLLAMRHDTRHLPLALVSADAAVAAAIAVAGSRPSAVGSVVGCYGRPDLAPVEIGSITVPTLLVVPSKDQQLVRSNERVFESLNCPSQLAVIVGASRAFTEPGTQVACEYVVGQWCERYLPSAAKPLRRRY